MPSSPGEPHRTLIDERYSLEAPLGKGSMGTVWQAFDSRLQRHVALKLLQQDGEGSRQHVRELQALSRLRHPNLVTVLDCGATSEGAPYLAMELVLGTTMKDELKRVSKLSVERVCRIGSQIVRALIGAHAEGVVHRDLKPSNIMLSELYGERDFVKLVDFGVAHLIDTTRSTRAGARFVGTSRYASPEQCRGGAITASSDLYSLGVVLFELLSGRPLFPAEEELGFLWHHVNTVPPRLSQLDASVPAWLDELISALLAKDPKHRPKDAHEVLACFEGARGPEPASRRAGAAVEAAPGGVPSSSPSGPGPVRQTTRKPALVTAMVLMPALLLALILVASKAPSSGAARVENASAMERARARFEVGMEAYRQNSFRAAIENFKEADRLAPSARLSFNIALAYERMNDVPNALAAYRDYLRRSLEAENATATSVRNRELELQQLGVEQIALAHLPAAGEEAHAASGSPREAATPEQAETGTLQNLPGTAPEAREREEAARQAVQASGAESRESTRPPGTGHARSRRNPDASAKPRPEAPKSDGSPLIASKRLARERAQQKAAEPVPSTETEAK